MEKLSYNVPFAGLLERYSIKQSALSYRVKALKLKTQRRGRNTFLSINQLALLDDLHAFLKENPTQTIEGFLDSTNTTDSSLISQDWTDESSMNHSSISDMPVIHHSITNESLMNKQTNRIEDRLATLEHLIKKLLQEFTPNNSNNKAANASLINNSWDNNIYDELDKNTILQRQVDELIKENSKLQEQLNTAIHYNNVFSQQISQAHAEKKSLIQLLETNRFLVIQIQNSATKQVLNLGVNPIYSLPPSTPITVLTK